VVYKNGTKLADVSSGTSYTATGLSAETSYEFQVSTKTSAGESVKTEAISITTPKQPDPYGNEKIGFLNMSAVDFPDGLDVKNGHAYVGHFLEGCVVCYNYRYVRDLTLTNGSTKDIEVSRQGTTKVPGVAVNGAIIWAAVDQFDKDGWNLYKLDINGNRQNRFKIGESGTILSDVAVDAGGLVYLASRTHRSIVKFNEAATEAQYFFSGATLIDPLGVAVDSAGDVYTFDSITQKVIKFAKADGARLLEFGPKGVNNAGEVYTAVSDIAVDPRNGDIYVTGNAAGTVKIFRYNAAGNFLRSFKDADLKDPRKLTVDADGKVYVTDNTAKGVMVFSAGLTP
jgi:DNA-binding beta-propeller fold protein YncE